MPNAELVDRDSFISLGEIVRELLSSIAAITNNQADDNRYVAMARDYRLAVAGRPWVNACIVARQIGAQAFGITVDDLLAINRCHPLVEKRHKIMAFTAVVTGASISKIGHAFHRDHSTVIYALSKYEPTIRAAIYGDTT